MASRTPAKTLALTEPGALAAAVQRDLRSMMATLKSVVESIDELLTDDGRVGLPGDVVIAVVPSEVVC